MAASLNMVTFSSKVKLRNALFYEGFGSHIDLKVKDPLDGYSLIVILLALIRLSRPFVQLSFNLHPCQTRMNFRTQERQIERTQKEIHQPAHLRRSRASGAVPKEFTKERPVKSHRFVTSGKAGKTMFLGI